ncbi:extracellular solute-binding protein [Rhodospirillum rubrum F11]|nr:extracellular solute-binding protein [Rhodospirillum rubrum F11]
MRWVLLAASAALLMAPASFAVAGTPKDTLVFARNIDEIISLDPAENFESVGGETLNNLYTRLVTFAPGDFGTLVGGAAESWTVSEDGKVFTFKIRPGLTFPSGRPLRAQDAAFSLQRAVILEKTPAFILTQFGWTKDNVKDLIQAPSDDTLRLTLPEERAPSLVINSLTATVASVVDAEEALAHAKDSDLGSEWLKTTAAGTGAYRLIEWKPKQALSFEANPKYYLGEVPLKRVIVRHIPDPSSQRLLLEKGDVDIARDLTPDQIATLEGKKNFHIWTDPKQTVYYLNLNLKNPELAKPKVREAIRWLVDYKGLAETVLKGRVEVHQAIIGKGTFGSLDETPFRLDVAKAKALLAEAGVADGFKITIDSANSPPASDIAQSLQSTFAQAGITLEIIQSDRKQLLTKYRARAHDIVIITWEPDYLDPHSSTDYFTRNTDNSDSAKSKTLAWRASWDIPELTRETDKAVLEIDTEKRKAAYLALQREIQTDSPIVVLFQKVDQTAGRQEVTGFDSGPTGDTLVYARIRKD